MGMHPQLGSFTPRQSKRLFLIKELGCVCCRLRFEVARPGGDGHHAEDEAGRAISHDAVICLCLWHHKGIPEYGETLESHGPSRHRHARAFEEEFGTDLVVLEIQNQFLEVYLETFLIRPI